MFYLEGCFRQLFFWLLFIGLFLMAIWIKRKPYIPCYLYKIMKKQIILLFILFFLLNLFWEVAHSPLYDWDKFPLENNIEFYILRILYSSIWDFIYLSFIFLIISIKNKNYLWLNKPSKIDYIIVILIGIIIAIIVELRAILTGRWFYNEAMLVLFGIGLTPLVQLSVTFLIALWLARKNR